MKGFLIRLFGLAQPVAQPTLYYLEEIAIVTMTIRPLAYGQVSFRGSYWLAVCKYNIVLEPGTHVRVISQESIPLWVEPLTISRARFPEAG